MRHDPVKLAAYLRDTATLYEQHARGALEWLALDWTQGRAASLEARVSGSSTGDPVSAAALAELERTMRTKAGAPVEGHAMHPRSVLYRWVEAVKVIGLPVPVRLRGIARDVELIGVFNNTPDATYKAARTITDILHLCRPISRETADKILEAEQRVTLDAGYCQACESPAGPTPDGDTITLHAGLCRPGCYDIERRRVAKGTFTDRASFCADIVAGVTRGEIHRPASPRYRTAVPVLHEGEVA